MPRPVTPGKLRVPGATIYYEVRGSGPMLLIIPGGPQDAGVFTDLAQHLANRYTVVAYDPRGNSRSTFDAEPEELRLDVQGDDAARLIDALGDGPADVFGTSGGAQIGFNLAARYPARVRTLVAHEPPAILLLDDPSAALAADQEMYDAYHREGVEAAIATFLAANGLTDEPELDDAPPGFAPTPEDAATFDRVNGNFEYWLVHGNRPLSLYRPDLDTLRAGQPRVVVGIGERSAGQIIHGVTLAVAEKLGTEPVSFPGDHMGFGPDPGPFAETLHRVLSAN